MSQVTSPAAAASQLIFTSPCAPTACHFANSMPVKPSEGGARKEAGSISRKRPLRSKSCASTAEIVAPASCAPRGRAMATGSGWTRPPERSMTGRSGAARSRARTIAGITGVSGAEVQQHPVAAERSRELPGRRWKLRLLHGLLQRLIEEGVAGFLLELVLQDAAVGPDVREHRSGEIQPLALGDHGRYDVVLEDRVVDRGEVGVTLFGGGRGSLRRSGRGSGALRIGLLARFRRSPPRGARQRAVHQLAAGRLALRRRGRRPRRERRGGEGRPRRGGRRRRFLAR